MKTHECERMRVEKRATHLDISIWIKDGAWMLTACDLDGCLSFIIEYCPFCGEELP